MRVVISTFDGSLKATSKHVKSMYGLGLYVFLNSEEVPSVHAHRFTELLLFFCRPVLLLFVLVFFWLSFGISFHIQPLTGSQNYARIRQFRILFDLLSKCHEFSSRLFEGFICREIFFIVVTPFVLMNS